MLLRAIGFIAATVILVSPLLADDWPTFRHDARRGGVTAEKLALPLQLAWTRTSANAPSPAWPPPAKQDLFHKNYDLHQIDNTDHAFHTSIVGERLFYGSSSTDTVYCVSTTTGQTLWTFTTEGPVRIAPVIVGKRVFVASDDGLVYCLAAADGRLIWKHRIGHEDQRLPGSGRMISRWPVRAGLIVEDGVVYATAGVFPKAGVFLAGLDAATGQRLWRQKIDIPAHGYIAASPERLYIRTGRADHYVFARADGKPLGKVAGGGAFAILLGEKLVSGPNEKGAVVGLENPLREKMATVRGLRLVAHNGEFFASTSKSLIALSAQRKIKWKMPLGSSHALIMAGNALLVGGDKVVTAHDVQTGKKLWQAQVDGRAIGLAVADGALFVSTDRGTIHCFRPAGKSNESRLVRDAGPEQAAFPNDALQRRYRRLAELIVRESKADKGYCLVLDSDEGRLAYELARITKLQIICVEADAKKVARSRGRLLQAGLYGRRVSVHQHAPPYLPYQRATMNLIVCDGALQTGQPPSTPANVVATLQRPYGGAIVLVGLNKPALAAWAGKHLPEWRHGTNGDLPWAVSRRGVPPGAGSWTHQYADPANTANSDDALVGGPLEVQWYGSPGPRNMVDRHNRTSSPVFAGGRLFISGQDYLTAVDAFNGSILWERAVPNSMRLHVPKDCSNLAADDAVVYLAAGSRCLAIGAESGKTLRTFEVEKPNSESVRRWGYLAYQGDVLVGSSTKDEPAARTLSADSWRHSYNDRNRLALSDDVFGFDRRGGERLWRYAPADAVIINSSIALEGANIYFVEATRPKDKDRDASRLRLSTLAGEAARLVVLDAKTGKKRWSVDIDLRRFQHALFLSVSRGVVLLSGSKNVGATVYYDLIAYDTIAGKQLWQISPNTKLKIGGEHGEQDQHPAVVGDVVYTKSFACNLHTGKPLPNWRLPGGGCGTLSACRSGAFFRSGGLAMAAFDSGRVEPLSLATRPGCWINVIPAGGLVLAPEGSSGCTCGYALQTSLALSPVGCPPPTLLLAAESRPTGRGLLPQGDFFAVKVVLNATKSRSDDAIHYTTDGTWPTRRSPRWQGPLTLHKAATIQIRAFRSDGTHSPVVTRHFTLSDVPRFLTPARPFVVDAKVELERPYGPAEIRYTLNGTDPTAASPRYEEAFQLTKTTTVRAALFHGGKILGPVQSIELEKISGRMAESRDDLVRGLDYEYYEGKEGESWEKLPDFSKLTAVRRGTTGSFSLLLAHRPDQFALRYTGFIEVPADGIYTFSLQSDDGSRLMIGEKIIVDYDGLHDARRSRAGQIALARGRHPITVTYFDGGLNEQLIVGYAGPGFGRQQIPAKALFRVKKSTASPER